ncbi:hypothetical protein [Nocardia sp. NPDC050710]|uniref:hypothetical protein n=1 Tax=Nocardia sp. NPDC050710 TaxID=3157220 RepID=UPI0033D81E14
MDLDQINTRTAELAARLGVQPPLIESGRVPQRCAAGVFARLKKRQPALVVGPAFDKLTATEQDGTLAENIVALDLFRAGRFKFRVAVWFTAVLPLVYLLFVADGYVLQPWQGALVGMVVYVICHYVGLVIWYRRITYQADRRLAAVFGRPFMDLMFELDARLWNQRPDFVRTLLKLLMPSEARRAQRLDAIAATTVRSTTSSR